VLPLKANEIMKISVMVQLDYATSLGNMFARVRIYRCENSKWRLVAEVGREMASVLVGLSLLLTALVSRYLNSMDEVLLLFYSYATRNVDQDFLQIINSPNSAMLSQNSDI
jgi:hypothetical protein